MSRLQGNDTKTSGINQGQEAFIDYNHKDDDAYNDAFVNKSDNFLHNCRILSFDG